MLDPIELELARLSLVEIVAVEERLGALHDHRADTHAAIRRDTVGVAVVDPHDAALEPRLLEDAANLLRAGARGDSDQVQSAHLLRELALAGGAEGGAHLVHRRLDRLGERHEAHLRDPTSDRDEERRLARVEVHGRERVRAIEGVASTPPALGVEGELGVAEGVEIAVDRANGDIEALGEGLGGRPGAAAAEVLGDGEEARGTTHPYKPDIRLTNWKAKVTVMKIPVLVLCEFPEAGIAGVDSFSPFCAKVIRALRAAGLPYASRRAPGPHAFKALNPTGQLPILLVDDVPICDSTRILRKIRALAPDAFPGDLEARGESHLWEELADTHLNGFLVAARWADGENWPSVKRAYFGAAPWFVQAIVAPLLRAKVVRGLHARDVWRAGEEACWEALGVTLDALEERAPERGFWLDAGFSTADIALSAQLDSLRTPLTPQQATLVAARPRLASWLDRVDAETRRGPRRALAFEPPRVPAREDRALRAEYGRA